MRRSSASAGWYFLSPMTGWPMAENCTGFGLQSGDEGDPETKRRQTAFGPNSEVQRGGFMSRAVVRHWTFLAAEVVDERSCLAARCPRTTARLPRSVGENCWRVRRVGGRFWPKKRTPDESDRCDGRRRHGGFFVSVRRKAETMRTGVGAFDGERREVRRACDAITASSS